MDPLAALGALLRAEEYRFVAPTPETHRRVLARREEARTLRDVFGWSRPFAPGLLPSAFVDLLDRAGALDRHGEIWRSRVRYATMGPLLCAHSAYPTVSADAVFFGPDTYRFASFLLARAPERSSEVQQVSFTVGSLADLRAFYQQIKERGYPVDRVVNHGIAFGCYFRDPEGNWLQIYEVRDRRNAL